MKYDPQVDILRIRFNETPIEESEEVQPGLILDFDAEGHVVGVELVDASLLIKQSAIAVATSKP